MAHKGLRTLIRLSKWNVDEKQRVLVALQGREDQILGTIRHEEARLKEEQRIAADDSAGLVGFSYGAYANAWLDRRQQLFSMLDMVRAEIIKASDELSEAFNELKTYEITLKERERREQEERDRKEQAFLDEVGLNIHRRKGGA
jgi:flagellar export protein FliJ